jgi:hypothetical protein
MIRVGSLVRAKGRLGVVTYVHYVASLTPSAVTVCVGPGVFDLIHPNPESVVAA